MKNPTFRFGGGFVLGALFALVFAGGCGGGVGNEGDVVGGSCDENEQCVESCVRSDDFPEGMCAIACDEDADCPSGTACIDEEDGICLLLCDFDEDCRSGYECDEQSRQGHSGSASVCIDG